MLHIFRSKFKNNSLNIRLENERLHNEVGKLNHNYQKFIDEILLEKRQLIVQNAKLKKQLKKQYKQMPY